MARQLPATIPIISRIYNELRGARIVVTNDNALALD